MKINQQMSEFQLAQAQKEIVEDVLGVKHVVNTSRNAINNFNKKLGKELHVKTTDNPTLTNLIKDTAKMKKANVHYEPNTSLWYKIDGDTLYIRGHEAEGYSERVLYTDETLSNNGWVGCTCTKAIIQEQIVPISCASMFRTCKQLTTIQGLQNIVMNCCTSCYKMFFGCYALQSIDCSNWDTYNVEYMERMFYQCYALKDIIGLNNLDVSNVKNMKYMFCGLEQFTDLDISKWNAPKCEDAQYMFSSFMKPGNEHYNGFVRINAPNLFRNGCVKYLQYVFASNHELKYVNVSNWNVSNVTDMSYMFNGCYQLKSVGNLCNWNVSNVTTMEQMFANCCNLKSVGDLSKWNAPKCTNAKFMFGGDKQVDKMRFTSLTLNNLFKNGIVENISCMFQKCYDLESVGNLDDWNTSNVTDMLYMFNQCYQLKSIGNLSKWDVQNVIDSGQLFYDCVNLKYIGDLSNWNMPKCTNARLMFACQFKETPGNKFMQLEQLKLNNLFKDGIVSNVEAMFQGCNSLQSIGDVQNWDMSHVTNMCHIFNTCTVNGLNMKNWDTSNINNMNNSFCNLTSYGGYGISYIKSLCPIHKGTSTNDAFQNNINLTIIEDSGTISESVNFAYSPLTHDSALVLINALDAENPGTLTLSTETYATLTDEDKAIATSKGWTIAA